METNIYYIVYTILELFIVMFILLTSINKHKLYSILILPSYMPMGTLASR